MKVNFKALPLWIAILLGGVKIILMNDSSVREIVQNSAHRSACTPPADLKISACNNKTLA